MSSEVRKPLLSLGRPLFCLFLRSLGYPDGVTPGNKCACSLHPCSAGRAIPQPPPLDRSQAAVFPLQFLWETPPSWALSSPEEASYLS